jgi:hypothetical protein
VGVAIPRRLSGEERPLQVVAARVQALASSVGNKKGAQVALPIANHLLKQVQ